MAEDFGQPLAADGARTTRHVDEVTDEFEILVRCQLPTCRDEADVTCRRSWFVHELIRQLSAEFGFATGDVRLLSRETAMDSRKRLGEYRLSSGDVVLVIPEQLLEKKSGRAKKTPITFAGVATTMMMIKGTWRHVAVLPSTLTANKPSDTQPRGSTSQTLRSSSRAAKNQPWQQSTRSIKAEDEDVRYALVDAASYEANRQLARQGDGGSMVRLAKVLLGLGGADGTLLVDGSFVQADEAKALWYLHQAAQVGNAEAAYFLGLAYSDGSHGLKRDHTKGNCWLRAAVKCGHKRAMFRLATHYACGVGVHVEPKRALDWFLAAAEEDADHPLGACKPLAHSFARLVVRSAAPARANPLQTHARTRARAAHAQAHAHTPPHPHPSPPPPHPSPPPTRTHDVRKRIMVGTR